MQMHFARVWSEGNAGARIIHAAEYSWQEVTAKEPGQPEESIDMREKGPGATTVVRSCGDFCCMHWIRQELCFSSSNQDPVTTNPLKQTKKLLRARQHRASLRISRTPNERNMLS